jgi:NADPH2:quinone reductase
MKAVLCKTHGPPESLVVEDMPDPVPGEGEVLVRVKAAGLNFFDTLIIQGKYQVRPEFPFSPSAEIAGVTEDGTRVMAFINYGGAREIVAVPRHKLVPIPAGLSDEAAAGLSVTYGTTLHALRDRGHLKAGETLAVLGASGGVGQAAVEIGKAMGARVIACASSADKLAFAKSLGADELVDYEAQDLKEALKSLTQGQGVDVIYDPVGGAHTEQALRAIAWGGRFLVIGFASGEIPKLPLNLVLLKSCDVVGVFWGAHTEREPEKHRANMAQLLSWAEQGAIRPQIYKIYRMNEIAEALNALARREVKGKAILKIA